MSMFATLIFFLHFPSASSVLAQRAARRAQHRTSLILSNHRKEEPGPGVTPGEEPAGMGTQRWTHEEQ